MLHIPRRRIHVARANASALRVDARQVSAIPAPQGIATEALLELVHLVFNNRYRYQWNC